LSGQLEINFGYFDRQGLIKDAVLGLCATAGGANVSEAVLKAVLHSINDKYGANGEAWPSQSVIAREASVTRKTVSRAIDALVARSLLIRDLKKSPRGIVCNHYRIVWSELALLGSNRKPNSTVPKAPAERPMGHSVPHRWDMVSQRPMGHGDRPMGHGVPHRWDMVSHELIIEPIKETTTSIQAEPEPKTETDPWAAVVDLILDLESGRRPTAWQSAIASAKASGVSPDHAAAIVRHFGSTPGWDAGALVRRLQRADERIAPTDGWPAAKAPKPQQPGQDAAQQVSRIEFETIREGRRRKADERQIAAAIERRCRQADLDPAMSQFFTRIQRSTDQTPTQTEQSACPASTV